MRKLLYRKFDKDKINQLPIVKFPGNITVIRTTGETERAVDFLLQHDILGIDTETRPVFKKNHYNKVALLQVSTEEHCFLFRLNYTGMTPAIIRLLEDAYVMKVGLSLNDDVTALFKRQRFIPTGFVDLQSLIPQLGVEDLSLQKLYANLLGGKISKNKQLSNWEADVLTEAQKLYAATDAWACLQLYKEYQYLMTTKAFDLVDSTDNTSD